VHRRNIRRMMGRTIMSRLPRALFAGIAAIASATAAGAAEQWNTTSIALPDGSVAEIEYLGDVPPRVTIAAPVIEYAEPGEALEYEYEDADAALPVATRARRMVEPRPAPSPEAPQFVIAGDAPSGSTYEYTLITTGADGKVCTQRTEWRSRGPGNEPETRRSDTGDGCEEASAPLAPAPAPAPEGAIPRPRIVPVDPDAI
jgi:hypothetical protein